MNVGREAYTTEHNRGFAVFRGWQVPKKLAMSSRWSRPILLLYGRSGH
jgi:hypothetical protein